ncbi:uncharacterized protein BO80DRAFT_433389 [Aspergillus ibericus CBS 121593]|uniref:C6 transcription factor n=1 Tax=Aspergillus ibericus CBS 121593 TaxID=1448316 RepID=A0A395H6S1_9EURO|nr:hypothetical protein BO80DRAFT_433389 [Aspergillus ibericus CBS 121593]RAL02568.1 hypothetical protein BO80DRAFT_433389 [Aspergillus ibericus CBS 121593]
MADICLPFALAQPSLLHGILALSSRHMMTLQPEDRRYSLAYHHHSQQFFSLFPNDLQKPPSLEMTNLAHSNIFLANVLSAADPMVHSWVMAEDPEQIDQAFSWIRLQARHQWILRPSAPWLSACYLQPLFQQAPYSLQLHPATARGITEPLPVESLRDLIAHGSSQQDLMTRALQLLVDSYDPDPVHPYLNLFERSLRFICNMEDELLHLLHQKDEIALVLFAYWLCHLVGLNLWCFSKASDECRAICCFLSKSNDHCVQALVEYPVRICDLMSDFRGIPGHEG